MTIHDDSSVSVNSLMDFLNHEIEQLREDIKTPGWTYWAIIAALASLGWLMILESEKLTFDPDYILLFFLLAVFAYYLFADLIFLIRPKGSNLRVKYSPVDAIFKDKSYLILYSTARSAMVILLVVHFSNRIGALLYFVSLVYFGMTVISPLIFLILINTLKMLVHSNVYLPDPVESDIPFGIPILVKNHKTMNASKHVRVKRRKFNLSKVGILISIPIDSYLFFGFLTFFVQYYTSSLTPAIFSSLKIAFLAFSILVLIRFLADGGQASPTLKDLINIRRDLVFGNIDIQTARQLAEISISGRNKSAIIQAETANCISTLQRIETELNQAAMKIEAASELAPRTNGHQIELSKALWESIREATYIHFRQARGIYLADKSLNKGLKSFISLYSLFEPDDLDFMASVQKLAAVYDQVKRKYDSTISIWLDLIYKIEGDDVGKHWSAIAVEELAAELPIDNHK